MCGEGEGGGGVLVPEPQFAHKDQNPEYGSSRLLVWYGVSLVG